MASEPLLPGRDMVERRTLGWGLKVDALGLGDFTRADLVLEAGRFPLVAGRSALLQDLTLAFCTGRGTDPLNLGFGFDGARLVAEEDDRELLRERLRAAAAVVVNGDPRVSRVVDVQLGADPLARVDADGRAQELLRDLWITITFDTLAGERTSATIGSPDADG